MHKRNLGELVTVKMTSGDRHCDLHPHGSYHKIRYDEEGNRWIDGKVLTIMSAYDIVETEIPEDVKECQVCKNVFDSNWVFMKDESCIRCFEKKHIINRDEYRRALREEFKLEFGIK